MTPSDHGDTNNNLTECCELSTKGNIDIGMTETKTDVGTVRALALGQAGEV